jgi:signal transduction histidine kinase
MMRARATRRLAVLAVGAVCVLVLGGLGWSTWSAVELDRVRIREAYNQSVDESRALALSRLDGVMAPILYRESARPYNHFRRYYKPTGALKARDHSALDEPILLESPLKSMPLPPWTLLYFQATEAEGEPLWSSPQVEDEAESVLSAEVFAAADRPRLATSANWLVALRDHYTPSYLLNELERAMAARNESRKMWPQASGVSAETQRRPGRTLLTEGPITDRLSRSAAEFVRRGRRLLDMEMESNLELCVPETVALENLEAGAGWATPERRRAECVPVWLTTMTPVWIDVTHDGQGQLAFVRSVVVQGSPYCTLQGVLIDWPRLRETLEIEVRDLFPQARLSPIEAASPIRPGMAHDVMQTIPARLETGQLAGAQRADLTVGLKVGLTVAWTTTLLALAAVVYGTMKYVTLMERRMRFVAAVTHELRTPLTSFQLYTDLLADVPEEQRDQRRGFVETLRKESKRLARLVENVLAYSRMEDYQQVLGLRQVTPAELLRSVSEAMADQCAASGKRLFVESNCPEGVVCRTDPELVLQILTNLVENACKYSAEAQDQRIWLMARYHHDGAVVFEVDDAGPGLPPHDRRVVFQPFRRGSSAEDGGTQTVGLGLGLALSRHWAQCLGGHLTVQRSPRNSGRYSCFALALPISTSAEDAD